MSETNYGTQYTPNSPVNEAMACDMPNLFFNGNRLVIAIQDGPIKEVGENGRQIDDLIMFCRDFITKANNLFPCRENSLAITKLDEALLWFKARTDDRLKRGVEGLNQQ